MSGFEVAGLVLGSLPLIISAIENYTNGVTFTKRLFLDKDCLETLSFQLRTEKQLLENSCALILEGILHSQNVSNQGLSVLQVWNDSNVQMRLQNSLGDSFELFVEAVSRMATAVDSFGTRLGLGPNGTFILTEDSLKSQLKRLKIKVNYKLYEADIQTIRNSNASLTDLTNQQMKLSSSKANSRVPNFGIIQSYAKSLYTSLQTVWLCKCSHSVNLRLEPRTEDVYSDQNEEEVQRKLRFRVAFLTSSHDASTQVPSTTRWDEADICVLQEPKVEGATPIKAGEPQPVVEKTPKKTLFSSMKKEWQTRKGVRFATSNSPNPTAITSIVETIHATQSRVKLIDNLCTTLLNMSISQETQCLGTIGKDSFKQDLGLFRTKDYCKRESAVSLRALLQGAITNPRKFHTASRLRVAVAVASSVLQLHQTPWLSKFWTNDEIIFASGSQGPLFDHPFVEKSIKKYKSAQSDSTPIQVPRTVRDVTLFSLGILLLELFHGKPLNSLREDSDLKDGSQLADYYCADRLAEELRNEAGAHFARAVRRCIRGLDCDTYDLSDVEYQRVVYSKIVISLNEHYLTFSAPDT